MQTKQIPEEKQAELEARITQEYMLKPHEIKAFSVVFVLDSYTPSLSVVRLPELRETLRAFVHILVQEELRDSFVGRETMQIVKKKAAVKQECQEQGVTGRNLAERIHHSLLGCSVLAKNLTEILTSF